MADDFEFTTEDESSDPIGIGELGSSVLWGTDWTVETMIAQLKRGNIELNPRFQRRDAWSRGAKSRFIESLIIGLPIPQIVLAESHDQRGRYIILDGKQRLLALMQFSGATSDGNSGFSLSGLDVRKDLSRKRFTNFEKDPLLRSELDSLLTHTIRTTVIRNWPSISFLHIVFQRLNTGSLKLSPQELRQAVVPGPFTDHADDASLNLKSLQRLLGRQDSDPRMRDVELLVRYLSFRLAIKDYAGRMKPFLDESCQKFNKSWEAIKIRVQSETRNFDDVVAALEEIFGPERVARKRESRLFNRSIFDVLSYYAGDEQIRVQMLKHKAAVKDAYERVIARENFQEAVDSDTAGMPHTVARFEIWGNELAAALDAPISVPKAELNKDGELRFI